MLSIENSLPTNSKVVR